MPNSKLDPKSRSHELLEEEQQEVRQNRKRAASATPGSKPSKQQKLDGIVSGGRKAKVDAKVAAFFYAEGIDFDKAESKYFKAMLEAVASYGAGYQPPTDKQLRSHLLVEAVNKLDKELTYLDPTIGMYGSTITCNGWSDAQMRPILNMLQVCPSGVRFVDFIDSSGKVKDAAYIAEKVGAAVEAAGEDCVDLVVTDLGYDNKQAGAILEQRFPKLTWIPCTAHVLNLFLEDIGKQCWADEVFAWAKQIIRFISSHQESLALFGAKSQLDLKQPDPTQFGTSFYALERLAECRHALEESVESVGFHSWIGGGDAELYRSGKQCQEAVMRPGAFDRAEQLVKSFEPAIKFLREVDSDVPCMGKVYHRSLQLQQKMEAVEWLEPAQQKWLSERWAFRWKQLHCDIHACGYVLDPEYVSHDVIPEVAQGFLRHAKRMFPDVPTTTLDAELKQFREKSGLFSYGDYASPSWQFWWCLGAEAPTLRKLAKRVLSKVSSACDCERNWSTYHYIHDKQRSTHDYIHNNQRNGLSTSQHSRLVYYFTNRHMCDKFEGYKGIAFTDRQ